MFSWRFAQKKCVCCMCPALNDADFFCSVPGPRSAPLSAAGEGRGGLFRSALSLPPPRPPPPPGTLVAAESKVSVKRKA